MAPLLLALGLGAGAGLATSAAVRRWPSADPAAPAGVEPATQVARALPARWSRRLDPRAATGLGLTIAVALIVAGATGLGVLLLMVRTETGLATWDLGAARWAARRATPGSTRGLRWLTELGSTKVVVPLVVAVALLERRRLRSDAIVPFLALAVGGQWALVNAVKLLVDRARPDVGRLGTFHGPSFPSGHAATTAAAYAALALVVGRRRPISAKALLAGGAVALAVVVAATRVLLGVHWVTDVVAGVGVGWGWAALSSVAFGGRLLRFGATAEVAEAVAVAEDDRDAGRPPSSAGRGSLRR